MAINSHFNIKFGEHFNSSWVLEDSESIATYSEQEGLFERLISNKEIIPILSQTINLRGPVLPDFEHDSISLDEQEHFINALLANQLNLAKVVCGLSKFSQSLKKRLVVIQRIYHAVSSKHHNRQHIPPVTIITDVGGEPKQGPDQTQGKQISSSFLSGNDALIEIGVKTGLNLVFSLLRQNWMLASSHGQYSLCNESLRTATSIVLALPPLSLANETKLTGLGIDCLNQVSKFLKDAASPHSGADVEGQTLASELMIALAAKRGSLCYVLEWVEMAMNASVVIQREPGKYADCNKVGKVHWEFFRNIVTEMIQSVVSYI